MFSEDALIVALQCKVKLPGKNIHIKTKGYIDENKLQGKTEGEYLMAKGTHFCLGAPPGNRSYTELHLTVSLVKKYSHCSY